MIQWICNRIIVYFVFVYSLLLTDKSNYNREIKYSSNFNTQQYNQNSKFMRESLMITQGIDQLFIENYYRLTRIVSTSLVSRSKDLRHA